MKGTSVMKTIISFILAIILPSAIFAQQGKGWGPGSKYNPMYNQNTVETITGEIIAIDNFTPSGCMSHGVHLTLAVGNETVPIHLGPSWYIENQDLQLNKEEQITVTGSRVIYDGSPAIIAAEVKRGNDVLKLRDENGYPLWAGRRNQK